MDRKFLDLYSDYLISSFGKVTATGLSELLDGELSHDQITSRLRQITGGSPELWYLVKPTIRKHESEEGVLIFDDTLEPKPYSDENTIVGWYFDHSSNRSVKGINILNCIYHNEAISLPVAFEIVQKLQEVTDTKTGKTKFVSEESKNEMMRNMLHVCCQNRLKFSYVLADSWFSSKENMQYIKLRVKKDFIIALKGNRLVALSPDDKCQGHFVNLESIELNPDSCCKVFLKGLRKRYELPAFDTLVQGARHVRSILYRQFYQQVDVLLNIEEKARLDTLFTPEPEAHFTPWNYLKQEPGSPTLTHLKVWLDRQAWLSQYHIRQEILQDIPDAKIKHFAAEAKTLDAARMLEMESRKRLTLAASLLKLQSARVLDDLAEMLIKRMSVIHQRGKEALTAYHIRNQQRTDELIQTLRNLVTAYRTDGTEPEKMAAMKILLPDGGDEVLQQCQDHMAYVGNNYFPFLWRFYKSHRAALFRLLRSITMRATTQNKAIEETLRFLLEHEHKVSEWLTIPKDSQLDLSWMSDTWRRLVIEQPHQSDAHPRLHRRNFEICTFSQLITELKSGDLSILGSNFFADYRNQLLSWEDYYRDIAAYGEMIGLPIEGAAFVEQMKLRLTGVAQETDRNFLDNNDLRLENGEPVLSRPKKADPPPGLRDFEDLIANRIEPIHLLDVLRDTEHWLHWTRFFGPISGHDAKIDDPRSRYLTATFCYGCHLGPAQTARSLGSIDRRQLAWIHWRHIAEEDLDRAIREVINTYQRFSLPKHWGTGKNASVDGTKWDLYEQNLLSEYHIRYGGYGGIGYYHVSDTYIALFSHFIPCGVWEAVFLLDGLLKNLSDIQPDTIHGDTQAQSTPVFALAALLGITLMPRIRNWKHLKFYRPDKQSCFTHIDSLFSDTVDWDLIQTHLPDMLRVVLSIKAGQITASTLLRKLGTYSRKNRLYQAFQELGCVIRTEFLLKYISSAELRTLIQSATNKSEAFNGFSQWIAFGNDGTISTNDRDEQRKIIKYNHLIANCIIFHNVFSLSRILHDLQQEGYPLESSLVAALSPYLTQHINRFGRYELDLEKHPPELVYDLWS